MIATAAEDQRTRERAKTSMEQATAIFAEKNIRFTDLRRKVFEEIASTQASVGAYIGLPGPGRAAGGRCRPSSREQERLLRLPANG